MEDRGSDSAIAYYNFLTASEGREDELRELLNRITIKHTYFFRNEPQFNVLQRVILPQIMEKKLKKLKRRCRRKTIDTYMVRGVRHRGRTVYHSDGIKGFHPGYRFMGYTDTGNGCLPGSAR